MTRPDWIDNDAYPFEDRFLDVDGAQLHYVDEGTGPPLLMLHGNPTWSFTWRDVIKGLRHRFRCIAPDYPGFGLSTAPPGYGFTPPELSRTIREFVGQLDLSDTTLLVQDWGGPIGFRVATWEPDRFAAFVIGNTWAWPVDDERKSRIFSRLLGGPRLGDYLVRNRNVFVERIVPGGVKRGKVSPEAMEAYRGPFPTPESRAPLHVLPRQIIAATPWLAELEKDLEKVRDRPALIVWPTKDQAFGDAALRRWEQIFPRHRTVLLEGAGHYIGEDAADEIVNAILEWPDAPAPRSPA
jgi:haloalkane dehalogenase